jgi:8-oxo-dGTP diphosphatase
MTQRKTVIVAAAVLREAVGAPVLLTRRMDGAHLAGMWELPGGKVEPGEDPEAAVVREVEEECGVTVAVGNILEVAFHAYEREGKAPKDVLLLFYDCRPAGPVEVRHLGVADHAWVPPRQLEDYPLPPPDARLVEKLKAGR